MLQQTQRCDKQYKIPIEAPLEYPAPSPRTYVFKESSRKGGAGTWFILAPKIGRRSAERGVPLPQVSSLGNIWRGSTLGRDVLARGRHFPGYEMRCELPEG